MVGHTDITTSKDIYSHQILDEPQERLDELKAAVGRLVGFGSPERAATPDDAGRWDRSGGGETPVAPPVCPHPCVSRC